VPAALLAASAAQTAVEVSLSNLIVLAALLLTLLGEAQFRALPTRWARLVEAQMALLRAPARWFWLRRAVEVAMAVAPPRGTLLARPGRLVQMAAPALILGLVFALLLGAGNAVFGDWMERAGAGIRAWLAGFDLSLLRLVFWATAATLALGLLRPPRRPAAAWAWAGAIPRWTRRDAGLALWQSAGVLLVLNAMFFAVNTIDALYLWADAALPPGVGYSAFVHQGVHSLIAAVVLSGAVLALMFQQGAEVVRSRLLRWLALAWIAQNVVLIGGVCLRLWLYVEAYRLTEPRVYVGCFLLLVATGFALLALHVLRGMGLGWLLRANLAACFALFFALQFADVAGFVARFNHARWEARPERSLDLGHLAELGPSAWPVLAAVAEQDRAPLLAADARGLLARIAAGERDRLARQDWRSAQLRRDALARWVIGRDAPRGAPAAP
jgi:hypothetical protein